MSTESFRKYLKQCIADSIAFPSIHREITAISERFDEEVSSDESEVIKEASGLLTEIIPHIAYTSLHSRALRIQGKLLQVVLAKDYPEYNAARFPKPASIDQLIPDGAITVFPLTRFYYTATCTHCGEKFRSYHLACGKPCDICIDCFQF